MTGKTTLQYQWLLGIRHWRLRCRMGNSYVSLGHRTGPSSSPTSSFSFNVNFDLFRSHHYRGSGLFLLREETPQLHNKIASTQAERSVLSKGKSRSINIGQLAGAIAQRPESTFHKYAHIRLRTSQSRSLRLNCWIHF